VGLSLTMFGPNNVDEKDYTIVEEVENNQQSGEEFVVAKILHSVEIVQHPTFEDLPIYRLKIDQHYYVGMFKNPLGIKNN